MLYLEITDQAWQEVSLEKILQDFIKTNKK